MDVGEFNRRRLYTGLRLDYRHRLWVPTSASRAISAVAEILVIFWSFGLKLPIHVHLYGDFQGVFPANNAIHCLPNPENAPPYPETRSLSHKA